MTREAEFFVVSQSSGWQSVGRDASSARRRFDEPRSRSVPFLYQDKDLSKECGR